MVYPVLKVRVARSKVFMRYAHSTKPSPCCVCGEEPFVQIHHFGSDGGRGLKPSDYQVARVCRACAGKWELKRNALVKNGYYEVLAAFQQDALELHEGWLREIEDTKCGALNLRCSACENRDGNECCASFPYVEPPADCALDELNLELLSGLLADPVTASDWLVKWANRRAANVIGFLAEPMMEIATKEDADGALTECKFVASQALKVAGIEV